MKRFLSVLLEIFCYTLCLFFVATAWYLPGFLEMKLDVVEEEIGFYVLDPEEREVWKRMATAVLAALSLMPLITGVLLGKWRRRSLYVIQKETIQ